MTELPLMRLMTPPCSCAKYLPSQQPMPSRWPSSQGSAHLALDTRGRPGAVALIGAPMAMTIYLVLTALAFRFGPWPWPVQHPDALYHYLTAAIALFFVGAIGGALASLPWRSPVADHRE